MDVTFAGMVMLLSVWQLWKARYPIEVTFAGIVIFFKLVQP